MEERFVELEKKITKTLTRGSHVTEQTAPTNKYFASIVKEGQQNALPAFKEILRNKKIEDLEEDYHQQNLGSKNI